jgi:hypothetical protein
MSLSFSAQESFNLLKYHRAGKDHFVFDSWGAHLKGSLNRAYGDPIQKGRAASSKRELFHWITCSQLCRRPAYVSARPFLGVFDDKDTISMATIYLDFDCELTPALAIEEAARAYDWMEGSGIIPRVYFSGKKGVALYIDCQEPAILQDATLKKAVLNQLVQGIISNGFKTLDGAASGTLKRISKFPNTLHPGSGLYCIPLTREDLDNGLEHIKRLSKKPREMDIEIHDNNSFHKVMEELSQKILESQKAFEAFNLLRRKKAKERESKDGTHCPGLSSALEGVSEGSRQLAAIGLKKFFMSKGEDVNKLREWNLLNQPPLDEETLQKIIDRHPDQSWCYYLNLAGLCHENCPKLK